MAGAEVPAAGVIGDDNVDNTDQEANFENLASAARRVMGIGASVPPVDVISAGSISPSSGVVKVDTEGAVSDDNLDWIDPANYLDDSLILVRATQSGRDITLRAFQGGVGQLILEQGEDFTLTAGFPWIMLRQTADTWIEVERSHGEDTASARSFLGLGTVATLDDGAVDAATLGGLAAAAFLLAGGTAVDSNLLQGLAAAAFLRSDIASLQEIDGGLKANSGILQSDHASPAGVALLNLSVADVVRGQAFYDGGTADLIVRLLSAAQAVVGGLRIRDGEIPDYWDKDGAEWLTLVPIPPFPDQHHIRWDKLDAVERFDPAIGDHRVIGSSAMSNLPGTGATASYRIRASLDLQQVGGNIPKWKVKVYIGETGDETDTLVLESDEIEPTDDVRHLDAEVVDVPIGTLVTLVAEHTTGATVDLFPSVQKIFSIDKATYLSVDQIG